MSWKKKFVRNWGRLGMRCNWKECTLGDLITFQRGHDLPKSKMIDGKYPVVGSNGIIGYHNEYTTGFPSITIGRSGNVGNPFIVYGQTWSHNTTLYVKDFKGNDPVFVYYFLKTMDLANYAGGSAVPTLNRNHIHTLLIKVPESVRVQKKIGYYLRLLDEKIELNNAINNNLEQQAQAVYYKMFSEVNTVPVELSSIIDVRDGTHDSPKAQATGYYLITSKHLLPFGVDKASANHISKADFDKINERSLVETQDILMSMIGTIGLISYIPYETVDFAIKNVALFKTSHTPELAYYFLCYLKSEKTLQHIGKCLAGSTQKYISLGELRKMPIYSPTTNEIREFNCLVKPMFEKIVSRTYENALLAEMRDSLLPKLMSGELDVSKIDI